MKRTIMSILFLMALVSCGKGEVIKQLQDGSHTLVEKAGDLIETVGRTPRQLSNKLHGTRADTDEKVDKLEDQVAELYQELYDMDAEIADLQITDQQIMGFQDYLFDEIRSNDRDIRRLRRQLRRLRRIVRNMTIECDVFQYFHLLTDCELQGN